jgi:hypothetical protein
VAVDNKLTLVLLMVVVAEDLAVQVVTKAQAAAVVEVVLHLHQ